MHVSQAPLTVRCDDSCHTVPSPLVGQGYRIWVSIERRNISSHPAFLIFRRMEALSGCDRSMLRAIFRKRAMFCGPLSLRLRAPSSSKTTSSTQWSWFSMVQWVRTIWSSLSAGNVWESRKYRVLVSSGRPSQRRKVSTCASARMPGKSWALAKVVSVMTFAVRCSLRPWLDWISDPKVSALSSVAKRRSTALKSVLWFSLRARTYSPRASRMAWAIARWQCKASTVTIQPLSDSSLTASKAPTTSLRPGASRCARAKRCSAAQTLTRCKGVALAPLAKAPLMALPSIATTPLRRLLLANAAINRVKAVSKASGSSKRSTRLKVSWLGVPCSKRRTSRSTSFLASPKSAMSAQLSAPHRTAASAMNRSSSRSCRAFSARGSSKSSKIEIKPRIDPSPTRRDLQNRNRRRLQYCPNTHMRFPCLAGEGWGGGWLQTLNLSPPPSLSLPRKGGGNVVARAVATQVTRLRVAVNGDVVSYVHSDHSGAGRDPGDQQSGAWRAAVPAVVRLLPDLWPDAHPQPDARLLLHAR